MGWLKDEFDVYYGEQLVGYYYRYSDGSSVFETAWGSPWDLEAQLHALGLDTECKDAKANALFAGVTDDANRVPGRKRVIYKAGPLTLDRSPQETGERFSVYRRGANEGDPDYSPLRHDAPHYEGPGTPEGMREWASWYAFNKMDDGTYQAELDEAWWWGGGHNDGGTIRREIPEEWHELPYEEFLGKVVCLAAAKHYGFTVEQLLARDGLREFFGYGM